MIFCLNQQINKATGKEGIIRNKHLDEGPISTWLKLPLSPKTILTKICSFMTIRHSQGTEVWNLAHKHPKNWGYPYVNIARDAVKTWTLWERHQSDTDVLAYDLMYAFSFSPSRHHLKHFGSPHLQTHQSKRLFLNNRSWLAFILCQMLFTRQTKAS